VHKAFRFEDVEMNVRQSALRIAAQLLEATLNVDTSYYRSPAHKIDIECSTRSFVNKVFVRQAGSLRLGAKWASELGSNEQACTGHSWEPMPSLPSAVAGSATVSMAIGLVEGLRLSFAQKCRTPHWSWTSILRAIVEGSAMAPTREWR
jgi:hypothetical protein